MAVEVRENIAYVIDTTLPDIGKREFAQHVHFKVIDGIEVGTAALRQFLRDKRDLIVQGGPSRHANRVDLMHTAAWAITGKSSGPIYAQNALFAVQGSPRGELVQAATSALYAIEII